MSLPRKTYQTSLILDTTEHQLLTYSLTIAINGVAKQLSLLKTDKASGPDAIPPWFLKEYAANIFQDSIESGTVPSRWKSANVCGVFKKEKRSDPSNYRPISLTCIASKILEHIVHSRVMRHFEHYNILTDCQHGLKIKKIYRNSTNTYYS